MPKPARDRWLSTEVKPAVKAAEEHLKDLRRIAKAGVRQDVELWDVKIHDNPTPPEPGGEFDPDADAAPEIVVHFVIASGGGELWVNHWTMVGLGPSSMSGSRTPLQTLARVAIYSVEDALAVREAHAPDGKLTHEPLPPEVGYSASVTDGQLTWGAGTYRIIDGQLQDFGGPTPRPRPSRPRASSKRNDARIPQAVEEYRRAISRGSRSPTVDVARALHVGRSTAARAIAEARRQGLLGPAKRTAAGEVLPFPTNPVGKRAD
jgi:hypothetical protein